MPRAAGDARRTPASTKDFSASPERVVPSSKPRSPRFRRVRNRAPEIVVHDRVRPARRSPPGRNAFELQAFAERHVVFRSKPTPDFDVRLGSLALPFRANAAGTVRHPACRAEADTSFQTPAVPAPWSRSETNSALTPLIPMKSHHARFLREVAASDESELATAWQRCGRSQVRSARSGIDAAAKTPWRTS